MSLRSFLDLMSKSKEGLSTKLGIDGTRVLTKSGERFVRAKILISKRVARLMGELRKGKSVRSRNPQG